MPASTEDAKKWGLLIAKVWDDDRLRSRLMSEPAAVLKEHGLEPPAGVEVKVVENTSKIAYLTLPSKPQYEELREMSNSRVRAPQSLPCPWPLCMRCL